MKKSILIACETLREELEKLIQHTGIQMDLVWMNGGLHTSPKNLRENLQIEINKHDGLYEDIILVYGFCGGGTENLETKSSSLILPRAEDCISILLGGNCPRSHVNERDMAVFLTRGWIRTFNQMEGLNIRSLKEKYGDDQGKDLYRRIYRGYRNIDIIDTGAYRLEEIDEDISEIQDVLGLSCKTIDGSLVLIEKLLNRDWDEDFIVKGPGLRVEKKDYYRP